MIATLPTGKGSYLIEVAPDLPTRSPLRRNQLRQLVVQLLAHRLHLLALEVAQLLEPLGQQLLVGGDVVTLAEDRSRDLEVLAAFDTFLRDGGQNRLGQRIQVIVRRPAGFNPQRFRFLQLGSDMRRKHLFIIGIHIFQTTEELGRIA